MLIALIKDNKFKDALEVVKKVEDEQYLCEAEELKTILGVFGK